MKNLKIFVDGAFSPLQKKIGIGIIFLNQDNKEILRYSNSYNRGSNNIAELAAVIIALRIIKKECESIIIYTDSQYVIGGAILGWQRKKNKILWNEFDIQYDRVKKLCSNIQFVHVKGHQSGDDLEIIYNNKVDELARKASLLI